MANDETARLFVLKKRRNNLIEIHKSMSEKVFYMQQQIDQLTVEIKNLEWKASKRRRPKEEEF